MVELMVGIVVSLICVLAIMSAFSVYEGQKRTTTSGNDAQQNAGYSLYSLERQIRTAGSGMVQGNAYSLWGCPITAYTTAVKTLPAASLPAPFNAGTAQWPLTSRLMPVLIASGGATGPDIIGVMSGNPALQVFKVAVGSASSNSVTVANSFGISASDYLLGTMSDGTCALGQISTISGTALNLLAANSPTTTGLSTATNVFDLGPSPLFTLFGVDPTTNSLVSFDLLQRKANANTPAVMPIGDGIIQIKALYGIGATDTAITWVQPTGATWGVAAITASTATAQTAYSQIRAIRVVVVAQSRLPERATDFAQTSTTLTLFPDLATSLQYKVPIQSMYRYKVYDTTIPIRNALISTFY